MTIKTLKATLVQEHAERQFPSNYNPRGRRDANEFAIKFAREFYVPRYISRLKVLSPSKLSALEKVAKKASPYLVESHYLDYVAKLSELNTKDISHTNRAFSKLFEGASETDKYVLSRAGLALIKNGKNPADLKKHALNLLKIVKAHPDLKYKLEKDTAEHIAKTAELGAAHVNAAIELLSHTNPVDNTKYTSFFEGLNTIKKEDLPQQVNTVKTFLKTHTSPYHTKVALQNVHALRPPSDLGLQPLFFGKKDTGEMGHTVLTPFGRFPNKLRREMEKSAADAWIKAHTDNYLKDHVEPILYTTKGEPMIYSKGDYVRIYTTYSGLTVDEELKRILKSDGKKEEKQTLITEIRRQQNEIRNKLRQIKIEYVTKNYGHDHDNNFTVEYDKEGKPNVRIIDFDQAQVGLLPPEKRPLNPSNVLT